VPLIGQGSVSNITVSLSFVVVPKALSMARLPVVASLLAILRLPPSRFCLLAPYCYTPLPGWHPTAPRRLAPYCYSPAGTILLIVIGWHPLFPVGPLTTLPPRLLDFLGYALSWYCTLSVTFANALDRCNSQPQPLIISCLPTLWFSHIPVSLASSPSPSGAIGKTSFV